MATEEQKAAIEHLGCLVAIARPGSGKTYIMSEKIRAVLPTLPRYKGIIAISHTNKASNELKVRSTREAIDPKSSFFGTIDKFCDSEILIPFLPHIFGNPTKEIEVKKIRDLPEEEREFFSGITSNQVSIDDVINHLKLIKKYFLSGYLLLETTGALSLYVLNSSKACRKYICAKYSHVFVDEYQDSGLEQHQIFLRLKELGLIAVAVGDADQSIFGFANKDPKYLLELAGTSSFHLFPVSYNHRSHPSIINYSQCLLDEHCELLDSDEIRVFKKSCSGLPNSIAHWIDASLPKLIEEYSVKSFSDVGILVRGGATGRNIHQALQTKHRYFDTHPLEEHFSLWARLFCLLLAYKYNKLITAEEIIEPYSFSLSSVEVRNVRRKIRQIRLVRNEELVQTLEEVAYLLIPEGESEEAKELLRESLAVDLTSYFEAAKEDEVQVMTIHKAKGLEFDIVFHLDLYEWVLPAKRPGPNNDFNNPIYPDWQQDVNLHYVGITRAKKACFLCTSTQRINASQQIRSGSPSEFFDTHNLSTLRITIP